MTDEKLAKLKAKIAALIATAKDKAATEAEAETALNIATRLMKENSLSMDDLASGRVHRSDFIFETRDQDRRQLREIDKMCGAVIGMFCDVKVFADRESGGMKFYGYNVDVELALYIRDLLIRTGEYEWKKYHAGLKGRKLIDKDGKVIATKTIRHSFFIGGFCKRINARLRALKGEMVSDTGTALVVLKSELVNAAFNEDIGMDLKPTKLKKEYYTGPAKAGEAAADKVQLNRAVGDGPQGGRKRLK